MRTVVSAALLLLLGCAGPASEKVRSATYPPSFQYLSAGEIKSAMRDLAIDVSALDRALRPEGGAPDRQQVLGLLDEINASVDSLANRGRPTGHVEIDLNVDHLRSDVRAAREMAAAEPPTYFLAGSIVGACVYCHR